MNNNKKIRLRLILFLICLVPVLICCCGTATQEQNTVIQKLPDIKLLSVAEGLNPEEVETKNPDSNTSLPKPLIILNTLEPDYYIGETIQFSGLVNIQENKFLYVEFSRNKGTQKILPENVKIRYSENIPVMRSDITAYNEFKGNINTTNFLPGNYTLLIVSLNQQGKEIIAQNQTITVLTEPQIIDSEKKSGNSIAIALLFALTAICVVFFWKKTKQGS